MIISDRGSQFVAHFWEQLHASLGTHLIHSLAYHPQMDGQMERVNQILEDMLRACVLEHQGSWDQNLPWAEFSYNNSYQESLKMTPFEVLYGRRCHTPLNWIELGEKVIFGPDLVKEAEATVRCIQDNLKAAKSCKESYANKRRRPLEFEVGDLVYLRVSPMKGVKRFGVKGKLAPRYMGPFPILEKCGSVAYKLDLPLSLARVHGIFHMSQLKKCLKAPVDVVLPEVTPLEPDMSYPEHPFKVLDQKDRVTRCKTIKSSRYNGATTLKKKQLGKVRTSSVLVIKTSSCHSEESCNCSLFLLELLLLPNLRVRFLLGGRAVTPLVSL
jgi:hypothetical protein